MQLFEIEDSDYYHYDHLVEKYPYLTKGTRSKAQFIKKFKMDTDDYLYARSDKKGGWIVTSGKGCKVDKFFIHWEFAEEHLIPEEEDEEPVYEPRPPIIDLSDDERFIGPNGIPLNIEVVGERHVDKIYFRLRDVGNAFGVNNLDKVVTNSKSDSYQEGENYFTFCINHSVDAVNDKAKSTKTKNELYLTYEGVLRVIFTSRNSYTKSFVKWATDILFTAQMGTKSQKRKLAGELLGLDAQTIKELNKATSGCISCIYLFSLGTVKTLRKSMKIPKEYPDDSVVYKYGRTGDLDKRTREHQKTYGKIKGVELTLVYHGYIDPEYAPKAETTIAHSMQAMDLTFSYDSYQELVIASSRKYKHIREQYDTVTELYRGRLKQILDELEHQKHLTQMALKDVEVANQKTLLAEKDTALAKKDTDLAKKDAALAQQEIKILKMQLRLAELGESC